MKREGGVEKMNVFVKPNEQCRACSYIVMARKRTFQGTKRTFSLSQMNNVELARTLSWRELEIANTELWAKWKGKTHFSRNENVGCCFGQRSKLRLRVKVGVVMLPALTLNRCGGLPPSCLVVRGFKALIV